MKRPMASLALAALAALMLFQSDAQSQRRRASRRTSNPARPQPVPAPTLPDEPAVVSTADDGQPAPPRRTTSRARQQQGTQAENEQLRGTVRDLSSQVEQLSGQLNQIKADQKAMFDLERLTRAEQRAEQFRTQLREVTDKEFQLQERLAEIAYESQSDSIQRRAALIGSLNPSAVRDATDSAEVLAAVRDASGVELQVLPTTRPPESADNALAGAT